MRRVPALGAVLVCSGILAACVHPQNERLAVGVVRTPSFGGPDGPGLSGSGSQPRAAWSVTIEKMPIDGVVHGPTLRTPTPVGRRSDAVAVGAYPNAAGWPERSSSEPWRAARELGRAAGDVVLMPLRAFWSVLDGGQAWSPWGIWKRAPGSSVREGTIGPAASRSRATEVVSDERP
ncbi:MAG: hypothetical protein D6692_05330 [Planctomycetota bacterium]|nr:MAG: hypothetical protein D6692_05330 [Planctomycetota bacterium]